MFGLLLVMVALVFIINGLTKETWFEPLLFAVAVAVWLTLEILPMIVTVNLAKGTWRCAQESRRQASQCDPEFRGDGSALYRQDRHADAGTHHPEALAQREFGRS